MLSRSNSNAGERVKRAKSTSSTHTASSGPRPAYQSSDPFVIRQQAETAALEAYYRAQQQPAPALPEYRAVPPKLERRRSRASGRTEGGHFEDARLGRRKSASRREDNVAPKAPRTNPTKRSEAMTESSNEERVITRKRSVIPPGSSSTYNYSLPSASSRHVRKSQSAYTDGSPLPRHSSALKQRRSTLQMSTPTSAWREPDRSESSHQSYGHVHEPVPALPSHTPTASLAGRRRNEEATAAARDRCLQDFQQKKLRERKSFVLGPFQKRKSFNTPKTVSSGYDTSLPPFNYADDSLLPPPPPPPDIPVPNLTIHNDKKTRNFSESLKGRFKKVFRRSSRVPSELPAQQVEGKHFYFGTSSPLSTSGVHGEKEEDPFTNTPNTLHLAVPSSNLNNVSGRSSAAGQSTKSRVTSWTNSTVAGTWSTRPDDDQQQSADEQGRLKRSDSVSTLRKATSFLGRPIKNKLRKSSRAELRNSEESTGLYTALQEHINSPQPAIPDTSKSEVTGSRRSSALAALPSQQRVADSVDIKNQWKPPTIRSVTPDVLASRSDPLSPVTEIASPETLPQPSTGQSKTEEEQSNSTHRSQLQRRPAIKAPTPSKEQIARRIERSKNRWQSPLDELSPPVPTANRATMEDNPYELRSLSRTLHPPLAVNDLPHHAKVQEQSPKFRQDMLSPSLYSRGTDGISPRPDTPVEPEEGGTMITITGHEVRSYSISPKKQCDPSTGKPFRPSNEWRRWLSDELKGWNSISSPPELTLPTTTTADVEASTNEDTPSSHQSNLDDSGNKDDSSPAIDRTPLEQKGHRRKTRSKRPSLMNDRYPMIDTGRCSSDKTVKHASRISSRAESTPGSVMLGSEKSATRDDEKLAEASRPSSVVTSGRVVSKHQSMATLRSGPRTSTVSAAASGGVDGPRADNEDVVASNSNDKAEQEANEIKPSKKTKSAFDLRANYKNNANGRIRPLAVRRKPETNDNILIFEDSTIQNIAAGPYASQPTVQSSTDANKENTPPSESNSLQALPSSEWLAAGTNKKRDARKTSAIHPAYRNQSVSRSSPSSAATPGSPGGGGGSPGQRLVSNWLNEKKSKENSPAFV